jgi:hypothetical protein
MHTGGARVDGQVDALSDRASHVRAVAKVVTGAIIVVDQIGSVTSCQSCS